MTTVGLSTLGRTLATHAALATLDVPITHEHRFHHVFRLAHPYDKSEQFNNRAQVGIIRISRLLINIA
jgi:hypothetical protein